MSHVHWWLVGLSFLMGLVLTSALILRPAKGPSLLEASVGSAKVGLAEPSGPPPTTLEWPTAQLTDAAALFSATVPVAEDSVASSAPVAEEAEATPSPVADEGPVPAEAPAVEGPVATELSTTREPSWTRPVPPVPPKEAPPAAPAPARKAPPSENASPVNAPPAKKAPPAKAPPGKRPRPAKGAPAKRPKLPYAPYGPGSARATLEGGGPSGWLVKGRSDTRLFYTPDDPAYHLTVAQVWFKDEQAAVRAAFTPWRNSSRRK